MSQKAQIALVRIGQLELEGLLHPNDGYGVAVSQICETFLLDKTQASRNIKALLSNNFFYLKWHTVLHPKAVNVLTPVNVELLIYCLAHNGNTLALDTVPKLPADSGSYSKLFELIKPKAPNNISKLGYIYLLSSEHILKLGYTTNVQERIKSLQRWKGEFKLLIAVNGTWKTEQVVHRHLRKTGLSCGDEWYPIHRKAEILNLLKNLK